MHVAPKLFVVAVALVLLAAAGLMYVGSSAPGSRELVVYTSVDPEYAEALARRFEARTGLAVALRTDSEETKTTGMLKILFHRESLKILGIHCFGANASEIIHIGQAIMSQEGAANTLLYFIKTTFNYPTMAEAYRVAAFDGLNGLF